MNKLFSENHTEDDCDSIDKQTVIYNLYEDIRCLKERVKELEDAVDSSIEALTEYTHPTDFLVEELKAIAKGGEG